MRQKLSHLIFGLEFFFGLITHLLSISSDPAFFLKRPWWRTILFLVYGDCEGDWIKYWGFTFYFDWLYKLEWTHKIFFKSSQRFTGLNWKVCRNLFWKKLFSTVIVIRYIRYLYKMFWDPWDCWESVRSIAASCECFGI